MVAVDADDPLVDTVVDRYRVLRKIGEGGMSVVYEVQHTKLARAFAMKRLLPTLVRHTEAVQRFQREAELLASLRHPNVVDISDWVTLPDGTSCMILEFLHGAPLGVRLQRAPLPWETLARMGDQAMSALQLAHRMGIVHRDLKPENIFISIDDVGEERVKILDFGVSKLRGSTRLSGVHEIVGTPAYMSPEQAQGMDDVGPSADVWAMGAILFEMATQRVAFQAGNVPETLMRIVSGKPESLLDYRKDAPPAFVELVERAITRDARRLQTIEELRTGLRKALATPDAVPVPMPRVATGRIATPVTGTPKLTPTPPRGMTAPSSPLPRAPTPTGVPVQPTPRSLPRADTPLPLPEGTAIDHSRKRYLAVGIVAALVITAVNVALAIVL